LWLDF